MFVKNVIKIGTGNVLAQLISLVAVPFITKMYSPEAYGVFAIYLAIVTFFSPIATLRFNYAMMLPERIEEARNLFVISMVTVVSSSILLELVIIITYQFALFPVLWHTNGMANVLWLIPVSVFVLGMSQVVASWAVRNKEFGTSAVSRLSESLVDRGLVLTIGWLGKTNAFGLIAGRVIGPTVATGYLFIRSFYYKRLIGRSNALSKKEMMRLAYRYKDFALISTLAALFDTASRQVPILIMSVLFPPAVMGFYALAMQVISVPMMVVGDAIASVFFQRVAEFRTQRERLEKDAISLLQYMLCIIIPPVLVLMVLGEKVFRIVFGERWQEAGLYVEIIAVAFLFMFLHRPFSVFFDIFECQKQRLWFDAILLASRVLVILIGAPLTGSPYVVLIGLSGSTVLIYAAGICYLFHLIGVKTKKLTTIVINKMVVFFPLAIGLWIAERVQLNWVQILFVEILLAALQGTMVIWMYPGLWQKIVAIQETKAKP